MSITPTSPAASEKLAIVGGGITGLMAAYEAIKNGVNPKNTTVLEAAERTNGVIFSRAGFNMGAEFVDTDQTAIRELVKELGLELIPAKDRENEVFQLKNGSLMEADAFYAKFQPLREIIKADAKEALANPDGDIAARMDNMDLDEYLHEVQQRYNKQHPKSYFQMLKDAVTFQDSQDKTEILDVVSGALRSEFGNKASDLSALQCAFEIGDEPDSLLKSDCAFRIKGGTETLLNALKSKLTEAGVTIKTEHRLENISRDASGYHLGIKGHEGEIQADKVMMAIPAYAYKHVNGMKDIMPEEVYNAIEHMQYTNNNLKVTVKTAPNYTPPLRAVFSALGLQSWVPGNLLGDESTPDAMTFLVHRNDNEPVNVAVARTLAAAAKLEGKTPAQMFAIDGNNNFVLQHVAPMANGACYGAAGKGDVLAMRRAKMHFQGMQNNGLAVTGTFLSNEYGGGMGFMDNGVVSAQAAAKGLFQHHQQGMDVSLGHNLSPSVQLNNTGTWQSRVGGPRDQGYLAV